MSSLSPPPSTQPASFVHLTPLNTEARRAFNDVALLAARDVESASISQGRNIRHSANFIVIEPWAALSPSKPPRGQSQSPPSFSNTGDVEREISSELNTSFGSSPLPAPEEFQYQGFYDLSFEKLPDIPRIGWVAGIGRWNPDGRELQIANRLIALYLSRPAPPPDISTTPSPWDFTIHDWVCKRTAGSGAFGTVSAAKHRVSSETAAAKIIVRTHKTMRNIAQESLILDLLPHHPRLLKKRGIYYERVESWFTSLDNEADERYGLPARPERVVLIIEPFARLTLAELLPHLSPSFKVIALYQILEGVHALHSVGSCPFIHRDLKLANIGVVSYDDKSIAIVILDYGQTIQVQARSPTRGNAGTPGYQTPEMEHQVHITPRDIWSCGIIGLRMFVPEWQHSSNVRTDFEKGVARLRANDQITPRHLVAQTLTWELDQRISASDALLHPWLSSVAKESSSLSLPDRKRHWQED